MLKRGEKTILVVAKLDRLSRSLADFARILAVARKQGWGVSALDMGVDTSTVTGELLTNVVASVSRLSRSARQSQIPESQLSRKTLSVWRSSP